MTDVLAADQQANHEQSYTITHHLTHLTQLKNIYYANKTNCSSAKPESHMISFSVTTMTCDAGDVIATYHYREAEVEKAPAIVGETALLAGSEGQYSVRPCGYR